jgi:DNA-directed RNA polymerase subunit K
LAGVVRPLAPTSLATTPQTYIKGPYFRGYLHREVTTVKYTRFERARIIGARALQISMGAPVLVDISDEMIDPIEISIIEFGSGAIPMTVKRED